MKNSKRKPFFVPLIAGLLILLPNIATAQSLNKNEIASETEGELSQFMNFIIIKIPSFIAAFILAVLFYFLARALKKIVEDKIATNAEENTELQILGGRAAYTVTLIIGLTVALQIAGIDLTTIIAAAGFGIGFALKDIITNFLAGVMILAQRQFSIGDYINVNDTIGKIIEIQTRATIMQALDGTKVVVPNSDLFNKQVISYTSNPFRRIEVPVGVEYSTDLKTAVETCLKAVQVTEGILLDPKPAVLVDEFADSSINLIVRAWVESRSPWLQIKSNLAVNIKKAFDHVDINIPFPIRTVEFKNAEDVPEGPKWIQDAAEKAKGEPPKIEPKIKKEEPVAEIKTEKPAVSAQPNQTEAKVAPSAPQPVQTESQAAQKTPDPSGNKGEKKVFQLPGMNE